VLQNAQVIGGMALHSGDCWMISPVKFPVGEVAGCTTDVVAETMQAQCDLDGQQHVPLVLVLLMLWSMPRFSCGRMLLVGICVSTGRMTLLLGADLWKCQFTLAQGFDCESAFDCELVVFVVAMGELLVESVSTHMNPNDLAAKLTPGGQERDCLAYFLCCRLALSTASHTVPFHKAGGGFSGGSDGSLTLGHVFQSKM